MKIKSINIKNFRLLENIEDFELNNFHTIIVGRNNSWKTSLTELFKKFCWDTNKFQFEDFSLSSYNKFKESLDLYKEYRSVDDWDTENKEIKQKLFERSVPKIELGIKFLIEDWDNIEFTDDLDSEYNEYNLLLELSLDNIIDFYNKTPIYILVDSWKFIKHIKENFEIIFSIKKYTNDSSWKVSKFPYNLKNIFNVNFIDAQRHLDDNSNDKNKTLSKIFELNYKSNKEIKQKDDLKYTIDSVNNNLDGEYTKFFDDLQNNLKKFWYPWLWNNDKELKLKSELRIEKLLEWNNAKVYYNQWNDYLPESFNGLWYSNLIYIILQLIHFYWEFEKLRPIPKFQLLFIEEPEAHLHPQMQQLFIKQIQQFIDEKKWNIQIVISTHSSHIVSSANFDNIRYFIKKTSWTEIKNLSNFVDSEENKLFLTKYLTLEKSDMFFSDKLIMIEWMVERILLPILINKVNEELKKDPENNLENLLSSQYISTIEVWGAYAHKFKEFLKFLEIKTLIITDIDSVDKKTIAEKVALWLSWDKIKNNDSKDKKYKVCESKRTSNHTLISWLPWKVNLVDLIGATEDDKIQDNCRVAYQIEENLHIWRSFEDAFILANSELLENYEDLKDEEWKAINKSEVLEKKFKSMSKSQIESNWHYNMISNSEKTDFAFDIMMLDDFKVPKYIEEGLIWLSK